MKNRPKVDAPRRTQAETDKRPVELPSAEDVKRWYQILVGRGEKEMQANMAATFAVPKPEEFEVDGMNLGHWREKFVNEIDSEMGSPSDIIQWISKKVEMPLLSKILKLELWRQQAIKEGEKADWHYIRSLIPIAKRELESATKTIGHIPPVLTRLFQKIESYATPSNAKGQDQRQWKPFPLEDCPNCGGKMEVFSSIPVGEDSEGESTDLIWMEDGEQARCVGGCGFTTQVKADGEYIGLEEGNIRELKQKSHPFLSASLDETEREGQGASKLWNSIGDKIQTLTEQMIAGGSFNRHTIRTFLYAAAKLAAPPSPSKEAEEHVHEPAFWMSLRARFFKECVTREAGDLPRVNMAPHDLFEWFKAAAPSYTHIKP